MAGSRAAIAACLLALVLAPAAQAKSTTTATTSTTSSSSSSTSAVDPKCPFLPNGSGKDIFPLASAESSFLKSKCSGNALNQNFHPCSKTGSCTYDCAKSCPTTKPGSQYYTGGTQPEGCGKAVVIKFNQGDINSCNSGTGIKAASGNPNANPNGAASYYCAGTGGAAQCCKACSDTPWCKTWVLVAPNSATENPKCNAASSPPYYSQTACTQDYVTSYYGGCGWCFLHSSQYCAPLCNSWGITNLTSGSNSAGQGGSSSTAGNSAGLDNIYWALYGRTSCGTADNDPHFAGADGARFEFNGIPKQSFCLVTDKNLHINMKMHGYYDDRTVGASIIKNGKAVRTWMRELGFVWRSPDSNGVMQKHTLHLAARSGPQSERGNGFLAKAILDGKDLPRLAIGSSVSDDSGLKLTFTGVEALGPYDVEAYRLSIAGLIQLTLKLRVAHALLQTPEDAEVHFTIMLEELAQTPDIHGVLGQTYRSGRTVRALLYKSMAALLGHPVAADGASGIGYLDGKTDDYISSSVLSPDCKFSAFA